MVSTGIAHHTVLHAIAQRSLRGSGGAEMDEREILEATRLPSQHVRFNLVNRVPPGAHPKSPDRVPARPSVNLGRSSDMEPGIRLEFKPMLQSVVDFSASNPQFRLLSEMLKAPLKVIRGKTEVP